MKHQQAVYLQEMGISRWQVRKPALFKGVETSESVDLSSYSLLVLSGEADAAHPLMTKIIKAFDFSYEDVFHCSMEQFEDHQGPLPEFIWSLLGPVNQSLGHKLMTSPSLSLLENNPKEKRALWEQFCAFNK